MRDSVLVTGASGNLGSAVSRRFLDGGYQVTAIVRSADDLNFMEHENLSVQNLDLNEQGADRSLQQIIDRHGPYTLAVLTVGGFAMGGLEDTDLEDIRKMIRLNFETAYTASKVMFQHFQDQGSGGRLILIGARPGLDLRQAKTAIAYGLSKSLIFGLADILNQSGRELGIDAAVIVPSIIDTPANRKSMPDADFGKWVSPAQLAENVYFLSTPSGRKQRNVIFRIYGDS